MIIISKLKNGQDSSTGINICQKKVHKKVLHDLTANKSEVKLTFLSGIKV